MLLTCSRSWRKVWSSVLGISNKCFFGWRDWENIWTCSFLRQYAERGYSRFLPFCSIAQDCCCSHTGASCYLSLCLSSKSISGGNCFVHPTLAAGPAWLESPRGAAAGTVWGGRAQQDWTQMWSLNYLGLNFSPFSEIRNESQKKVPEFDYFFQKNSIF